jgi:hypothetical protein
MPSYTDHDAALAFDCPQCYAEPGTACISADESRIEPVHIERVEALRDAISAGLEEYERQGAKR